MDRNTEVFLWKIFNFLPAPFKEFEDIMFNFNNDNIKELPDYTFTLKFATNLFRASQSTRKVRKYSLHMFYK